MVEGYVVVISFFGVVCSRSSCQHDFLRPFSAGLCHESSSAMACQGSRDMLVSFPITPSKEFLSERGGQNITPKDQWGTAGVQFSPMMLAVLPSHSYEVKV